MIVSLDEKFQRIRRIQHEDVKSLMAWDNDPDLFHLTGKKFQHDDDGPSWWKRLVSDRSRVMFAIMDDRGRLIGDVELLHILWRAREAELRISIGDKGQWDQGFGTQALLETLVVAFEVMALHRVYLRVRKDNCRAVCSYEKVGFRLIGRLEPTGRLKGQQALHLMEVTSVHYFPVSLRA